MVSDYRDDPEYRELIVYYLNYLRESLSTLKEDWANRDYSGIERFGHNIKGSGGVYGFHDISELGKEMEQAAKDQDESKTGALVEKLESVLNEKERTLSHSG
ncbi:MAG: Hpt domain-containing protein [Fidelibacterota bacterium]